MPEMLLETGNPKDNKENGRPTREGETRAHYSVVNLREGEFTEGLPPEKSRSVAEVNATETYDNATHEGAHHGGQENENSRKFLSSFDRSKFLIVGVLVSARFFCAIGDGIMAPFYPQEAKNKGISESVVGVIFTAFELGILVASILSAVTIRHVSSKFLCVSGEAVSAVCAILFGFLHHAPGDAAYITLCFISRFLQGLGVGFVSAVGTATMAATFPDNVATAAAFFTMAFTIGMVLGPTIGGLLYQVGGFQTPFIMFGCVQSLLAIIMLCVLPAHGGTSQSSASTDSSQSKSRISLSWVFRSSGVFMAMLLLIHSFFVFGFNDVTLSLRLVEMGLSSFEIAMVFLGIAFVLSVSCPLFGRLADKKPKLNKVLVLGGYVISAAAFLCSGPTPLLPIPRLLWLLILSQMVMAWSGSRMVLGLPIMLHDLTSKGLSASMGVTMVVSSLRFTFSTLGSLLGPFVSGFMVDHLGYPMACTIMAFITLAMPLMQLIYFLVAKVIRRSSVSSEIQHLLADVERTP